MKTALLIIICLAATTFLRAASLDGDDSRIAPGFLLEMSHPVDARLNGRFRVDYNGELALPHGIKLKASGLDVAALQARVRESYQPMFNSAMASPVIRLARREYWIDVRGLVTKPGRYLVKPGTSLDEIVGLSGGLLASPRPEFVRIVQDDETHTIRLSEYYDSGNAELVPHWRGGDRLFFQVEAGPRGSATGAPSSAVTMLGEVRTPGPVAYQKEADLLYYLTRSGGPTTQADLGSVEVLRHEGNERRRYEMDGKDPKNWIALREGDTVIVPADRQTAFERKLPLISALTSLATAVVVIAIGI